MNVRSALVLLSLVLLAWLAAVPLAGAWAGPSHLLAGTVAAGVCGLTSLLAVIFRQAVFSHCDPVFALASAVAIPVLRLAIVAAGAVVTAALIKALREEPLGFIAWLAGFYLLTLIADTWLTLKGRPETHSEFSHSVP